MRVVLATGNAGKLREFRELLASMQLDLIPQSILGIETPEETGSTFIENALLKARYASACSGLPAIADDSGLSVDALCGAPGVYSARYSGFGASDIENRAKLLMAMKDVPDPARTARFHCVIVWVKAADDARPLIGTGVWEGLVLPAECGSEGFWYDPIFAPRVTSNMQKNNLYSSVAQMPANFKNLNSHRAVALRSVLQQWAALPK